MAFLNAIAAAVAIVAMIYAALNIFFIVNASAYETHVGAGPVWFHRFLKSSAVAVVCILWLIFG